MDFKELLSHREQILKIAAKHGASNIQIFGSVARQDSTSESDIDFLVELERERTLLDQIAFIQDLEELLACKVDVVEPDCLHDAIRKQVLQDAIPL